MRISLHYWKKKKKRKGETSEGVTEEGYLSQDKQTCNSCHMYRTEQQNHSLEVTLMECLIQVDYIKYMWRVWIHKGDWAGRSIARWCPSHRASTVKCTAIKMLQKYKYEEVVKQKIAMIQGIPGYLIVCFSWVIFYIYKASVDVFYSPSVFKIYSFKLLYISKQNVSLDCAFTWCS